jgi:thiosulfate/3-mercaptopyruvate sulfurtransferase
LGTLIQAEELVQRQGEQALLTFDCRFDLARPDAGLEAYAAGHIPGAAYAHLNRDLSDPPTATSGRHPLPTPAAVELRLRALGLNRDSLAVAYDDGNGMYAARLWWMLRWLGHDSVFVLDGGLRRWLQLGLPIEVAVPVRGPGDFRAHPRNGMAVDAAVVAAESGNRASRLLDARAPERYRGEVEPIDAVAGHVPGAVNHPFTTSLGVDGRLLPAGELRAAFARTLDGVAPDRTIAMCGSGVTACHLLLAMEHAGLPGAKLYAGSWSEWSRDPTRPVARGPEP